MTLAVLSTAIAPPAYGLLLDASVTVGTILQGTAGALVGVHLLTVIALGWLDRAPGGPKHRRDQAGTA